MKVHVPHLKLEHKTRRLVYVGNGATSVDSEYNKTESADCDRRFVSTTWSGFSYPKLQNPFVREDADCIGFYAEDGLLLYGNGTVRMEAGTEQRRICRKKCCFRLDHQ